MKLSENDTQFIKVVNEISVGKKYSDTENFVKKLSENFSSQASESLKLFATNDLVENQIRNLILRCLEKCLNMQVLTLDGLIIYTEY